MTESPTWGIPPEPPVLGDHELHVWKVELAPSQRPAPRSWLSADERQRAVRFRGGLDAGRFIEARSSLREILGGYLDIDPQALRFVYGAHGKPMLAEPHAWLRFNLSHSGDLALVAVTRASAVGIDVERLRPRQKLDQIARRLFSREQLTRMRGARDDTRLREFFINWTALEAQLKARGLGIFDQAAGLDTQKLTVRHLDPHAGYVAAVAVAANPRPPCIWDFFSYCGKSISEE